MLLVSLPLVQVQVSTNYQEVTQKRYCNACNASAIRIFLNAGAGQ